MSRYIFEMDLEKQILRQETKLKMGRKKEKTEIKNKS